MLAVSGIDSTIKIFSPDAHARRQARHALGVNAGDSRTFSSISPRHPHRRQREARSGRGNTTDRNTQTASNEPDDDELEQEEEQEQEHERASDSDSEHVYSNGLRSRRRMQDEYAITSENDMNRRSGNNQRYISRGVMELLAARLGARVDHLEDATNDCTVM